MIERYSKIISALKHLKKATPWYIRTKIFPKTINACGNPLISSPLLTTFERAQRLRKKVTS